MERDIAVPSLFIATTPHPHPHLQGRFREPGEKEAAHAFWDAFVLIKQP